MGCCNKSKNASTSKKRTSAMKVSNVRVSGPKIVEINGKKYISKGRLKHA